MKKRLFTKWSMGLASFFVFTFLIGGFVPQNVQASGETVHAWFTNQSLTNKITQQPDLTVQSPDNANISSISVNPAISYQTYFGMGVVFDESAVNNLYRMTSTSRNVIMDYLFNPTSGLGYNLFRLPFGASDLTSKPLYSYDDMPSGQTDPSLTQFSIQKDIDYHIVDVAKQALQIEPNLKIYASVWSPPGWMKDNGSLIDGNMLSSDIGVYATYLRKAVEAYQAQGVPIYAVSPQNEPNWCNNVYTQACWTWQQERDLVNSLQSEFSNHGLSTKIIIGDMDFSHWDTFDKPILDDATANPKVDIVGFHDYDGVPGNMSSLQSAYPGKSYWVSETQNYSIVGFNNKLINFFRNGASAISDWAFFIDNQGCCAPNSPWNWSNAGFIDADHINIDNYWYNARTYYYGQFTKFLQRGAVRISSTNSQVQNVAFKNPDGSLIVVVTNPSSTDVNFKILANGGQITATIPATTMATYTWTPSETALNRTGWIGTASQNSGAASQALDGNDSTRWTTNAAQANGMYYSLDMQSTKTFDKITLDNGSSTGDYPRGYQVYVSNDGSNWGSAVATGTGMNGVTAITFSQQIARYVKIVQTGTSGNWWSVSEMNVYGIEGGFNPNTSTYYTFTNRNSGMLADVSKASLTLGAKILQYTTTGGANQQWQFQDAGGGYYRIMNRNSSQFMDVTSASTADWALVIQYTSTGDNQLWSITNVGGGYYKLTNKNSGKVLDVLNGSALQSTQLAQMTDNGSASQQWAFQ